MTSVDLENELGIYLSPWISRAAKAVWSK